MGFLSVGPLDWVTIVGCGVGVGSDTTGGTTGGIEIVPSAERSRVFSESSIACKTNEN